MNGAICVAPQASNKLIQETMPKLLTQIMRSSASRTTKVYRTFASIALVSVLAATTVASAFPAVCCLIAADQGEEAMVDCCCPTAPQANARFVFTAATDTDKAPSDCCGNRSYNTPVIVPATHTTPPESPRPATVHEFVLPKDQAEQFSGSLRSVGRIMQSEPAPLYITYTAFLC